jgi:hypothetical protein
LVDNLGQNFPNVSIKTFGARFNLSSAVQVFLGDKGPLPFAFLFVASCFVVGVISNVLTKKRHWPKNRKE